VSFTPGAFNIYTFICIFRHGLQKNSTFILSSK